MKNKVVALKYGENDPSPFLIAKGEDIFAEKLVECAVAEGIPVVKDDMAAGLLYELNMEEYVPEDLWEIVAKIYVYVYEQNEKRMRGEV